MKITKGRKGISYFHGKFDDPGYHNSKKLMDELCQHKKCPLPLRVENRLFKLMHFCAFRYDVTGKKRWRVRYLDIRDHISEVYLPMVLKNADYYHRHIYYCPIDYDELFSKNIDVLNSAVVRFSPWRSNRKGGYMRFSSYLMNGAHRMCRRVFIQTIYRNTKFINVSDLRREDEFKYIVEFHPTSGIGLDELNVVRKVLESNSAKLTKTEKRVLKMRYPMDGSRSLTLEQVAKKRGCSFQAVSYVEHKALKKLKKAVLEEVEILS